MQQSKTLQTVTCKHAETKKKRKKQDHWVSHKDTQNKELPIKH